MKINDANILLISARNFAPQQNIERHWQERWSANIKTAKLIDCPKAPLPKEQLFQLWVEHIAQSINATTGPIVLIAHSFAVAATLQALELLAQEDKDKLKGGFFVAPSMFHFTAQGELELTDELDASPYPNAPLPFPSFILASNNDHKVSQAQAQELCQKLESFFLDTGANGHIDETSGHGPWPEGLLVFSQFMQKL